MEQANKYTFTYASLTLSSNKDIIENLTKTKKNHTIQHQRTGKKGIGSFSTREDECYHGGKEEEIFVCVLKCTSETSAA